MIALLSGTLESKHAERVVIRTPSGVGYECFVPTRALEELPAPGDPVELHTHLAVREDDLTLFGFTSASERRVFQRLISASGVGPRLALAILSALTPERVVRALRDRDIAALVSVSGVGKKTAERLALELADKTDDLAAEPGRAVSSAADSAVKALVRLGYGPAEADEAVRRALAADGKRERSELVRAALGLLGR
jgi:Holliday junction DNA helicase RuvA